MIEENTNIDKRKIQIKEEISKSIAQLKEQLDVLEKEKLKEIDKFFEEIKENYIILKNNLLSTKECIENYYNFLLFLQKIYKFLLIFIFI